MAKGSRAKIEADLRRLGIKDMTGVLVDGKPLDAYSEDRKPEKPADRMNKTERRYSWYLDRLIKEGVVKFYRFGCVKVRLADATWYTVDFQVWLTSGVIAMIETKGGYARDDSLVKFKVAREQYPEYRWTMICFAEGAWRWQMGDKIDLVP